MLFLLASLALADDVVFISPVNGQVFNDDSTNYDASLGALAVVAGTPAPGATRWRSHINGHLTGSQQVALGFLLGEPVAMGSGPPWWASTPYWPSYIPSRARYQNEEQLLHPILVETFGPNGWVLTRGRRLVIDGRFDSDLEWSTDLTLQRKGVEAHLTATGLEALAVVHEATLVYPSLDTYNDRLDALVAALPEIDNTIEACFPLTDNLDFKTLPAWPPLLATAIAAKEAYDQTVDAAEAALAAGRPIEAATLRAAAELICVNDSVIDDHFEVCVKRIDTDPLGLRADRFDSATLTQQDSGLLASAYQLDDLDGTFDIALREVDIRWALGSPICTARPTAEIADIRYTDTPWLDEWSTCDRQHLLAERAVTSSDNTFTLGVDPMDPEASLVTQTSSQGADLEVISAVLSDTCAMDFIRPDVEDEVLAYSATLGDLVGDAWNEGAPYSDQAEALTLLFSGFDIGNEELPHTVLTADYRNILALPDQRGFLFRWDTGSEPQSLAPPLTQWMDSYQGGLYVPDPALTPGGEPYDLAINLTTDYLNQHLRAAVTEPAFSADLEPSWDDLGLTPPAGVDPALPATLTGDTLGQWFFPLAGLGNDPLTLRITPTLAPFVWIPPDNVFDEPIGEQKLSLSLGQVYLDLVQPTASGERVVLRAAIDIFDIDMNLVVPTLILPNRLRAFGGAPQTSLTLVDNSLLLCPRSVHANVPTFLGRCEGELERRLLELAGPVLQERLFELFRSIPLPTLFDADGQSDQTATTASVVERFSLGGEITVYLDLQ